MDPALSEWRRPIGPNIQCCRRHIMAHGLNRIDGQASAMVHRRLQQNLNGDAPRGCSVQRVYDRADIVYDEADEKQVTLGLTDQIQKNLLRTTGGDGRCCWAGTYELDIHLALVPLSG